MATQKWERILNETHTITSPFNEKMFLAALKAELSSAIFKELINGEKAGLKITITMEVIAEEKNL